MLRSLGETENREPLYVGGYDSSDTLYAVTIQLEGERTRPRVQWSAPSPTTLARSNESPFSN